MIKEEKKQLRKQIKELKKQYTPEELKEYGQRIMRATEKHPDFKKARNILVYWSLPDEVPTHEFIEKWGRKKQFILPRIIGDHLELREYHGFNTLEEGPSFGIMEPKGPVFHKPEDIDLALVPGLAFSSRGERLGRGGGYYDRTLPMLTNAYKAGLAFPFQIMEAIPRDDHDILLDTVITIES